MTQPHRQSEASVANAELLLRSGDNASAKQIFKKAADLERHALAVVPTDRPRTRGIVGVSCATLYWRSGSYEVAEDVAYGLLREQDLPDFAHVQLRELLEDIWNEHQAIARWGSEVNTSVIGIALRGPSVGFGVAPLDLVMERLSGIEKILHRVIEYSQGIRLRQSGPPSNEVRQLCSVFASQPRAGSYRFDLGVQAPVQQSLFPDRRIEPAMVTDRLISVIDAVSSRSIDAMRDEIPDDTYREVLLKLLRNIVPDGKTVSEIRFDEYAQGRGRSVSLKPGDKEMVRQALKREHPVTGDQASETIRGALRALHLDKKWVEVMEESGQRVHCQTGSALILDDIVGPMVNKVVECTGKWSGNERRRFTLVDIEIAGSQEA